jgi:protein required for attachment to host cells
MKTSCVVSADGSRARILMIEGVLPEEAGPELREVETLLHQENLMSDREVWTDKNNANRAVDGTVHGYDDHRERHRYERQSDFARRIVCRTLARASEADADRILVLAESKMLGLIRKAWAKQAACGCLIQDDDKNLSRLTPYELHHYLAEQGLLPERHAPVGWRGRAAS